MAINKLVPIIASLTVVSFAGYAVFSSSGDDPTITPDARTAAATAYDNAPAHTDLLTAPVAPGDEVSTGVTLPTNNHTAGVVLTGSAAGAFVVENLTETPTDDGTGVWLSVTARNTSQTQLRFTAEIGFGPSP